MSAFEEAWTEYGCQLYGDYDLPNSHGRVKVKCVLHLESRPSAVVNLETGKWRCFAGCGHGDVFDLIGAKEPEAREFLQQKAIAIERFGWVDEDYNYVPEPTAMNPNPRPARRGPKKKWKPSWL